MYKSDVRKILEQMIVIECDRFPDHLKNYYVAVNQVRQTQTINGDKNYEGVAHKNRLKKKLYLLPPQ